MNENETKNLNDKFLSQGNCNDDEEYNSSEDLYTVKSEAKNLLNQINFFMRKFVKIYSGKNEKVQIKEILEKLVNKDYLKYLEKFSEIIFQVDKSNRVKNLDEKINRERKESDIFILKENSELYKKRKKDLEIIKDQYKLIKNDVINPNQLNSLSQNINPQLTEEYDEINTIQEENFDFGINQSKENPGLNNIFTKCYMCRQELKQIHFYYPTMCTQCGDLNYKIRELKLDLTGRIAIVTGARVKIGYQTALKLLRSNCRVIATSRFPKDTLIRYSQESDFDNFKHNLLIYPLDLRMLNSIDRFIFFVQKNFTYIDILINNAAQTLRRAASYYDYLIDIEKKQLPSEIEKIIVKTHENSFNQNNLLPWLKKREEIENDIFNNEINKYNKDEYLPESVIFATKELLKENKENNHKHTDKIILGNDLQPIDFNPKSSWSLELDEVNFIEFAEVQIINSWAPFFLCKNLKDMFIKSPFPDRYIINVTGAEGIFYKSLKNTTHPHTNMAKASLNMLTHTSANYYKKFGIYMSCVDTGWVSCMQEWDMFLNGTNKNKSKADFEKIYKNVALDELDGAMRIIHPIIEGVQFKNYLYGCLLRNYKVCDWGGIK
jgi:NAD(P)-dependent dehydrogenase (short-subunit alcohol dehydrogenase family)